jgi:Ca2+-binding RTX toxin-like protein
MSCHDTTGRWVGPYPMGQEMAQTTITLTTNIIDWTAPDSDNHIVIGTDLGNKITSAGGDDVVDGGAGNDRISPSDGTDAVYGGLGDI